jgi:bacteriocin-like protein
VGKLGRDANRARFFFNVSCITSVLERMVSLVHSGPNDRDIAMKELNEHELELVSGGKADFSGVTACVSSTEKIKWGNGWLTTERCVDPDSIKR